MENKLTIICCYNNKDVYNNMLFKSIKKQTMDAEIIALDNSTNKFNSAAEALNYGAAIATGKYLIFAHQDIEFYDNQFFEVIVNKLNELYPSIIGIAGTGTGNSGVYTNIKHGKNSEFAGNNRILSSTKVMTLDEVFVAVERNLFLKYKFDERTCDNWHLYTVELCLSMGKNNIPSYVIPSDAYHKSTGVLSMDYYKTLDSLVKKHRGNYDVIYSTCSTAPTKVIPYQLFRQKINIKSIVKTLQSK